MSFNPRSRVGSDRAAGGSGDVEEFQSTLPRGERLPSIHHLSHYAKFQSTLPRGERHRRHVMTRRATNVSIHAPAWGATGVGVDRVPQVCVSIHAPAWGATIGDRSRLTMMVKVSIHAPAWGATRRCEASAIATSFNPRSRVGSDRRAPDHWPTCVRFNPRSRVGSDLRATRPQTVSRFQSTLPRGERRATASSAADRGSSFNPRSRVGSDRDAEPRSIAVDEFQSTLPRGERLVESRRWPSRWSFNPRSRVGSDCVAAGSRSGHDVSIHAPAWGATRSCRAVRVMAEHVSIHAPAWGATA